MVRNITYPDQKVHLGQERDWFLEWPHSDYVLFEGKNAWYFNLLCVHSFFFFSRLMSCWLSVIGLWLPKPSLRRSSTAGKWPWQYVILALHHHPFGPSNDHMTTLRSTWTSCSTPLQNTSGKKTTRHVRKLSHYKDPYIKSQDSMESKMGLFSTNPASGNHHPTPWHNHLAWLPWRRRVPWWSAWQAWNGTLVCPRQTLLPGDSKWRSFIPKHWRSTTTFDRVT